jgi:hypothetical protein
MVTPMPKCCRLAEGMLPASCRNATGERSLRYGTWIGLAGVARTIWQIVVYIDG